MSDNSLLDRITSKRGDPFAQNATSEEEPLEDLGAFGFMRGTRDRALMLELRKKSGEIHAVSYAYLESADFNPSEGIVLRVGGRQITIKGRNLNAVVRGNVQLFQGLTRHRVPWIQEADNATAMETRSSGILIESIQW